ncbi:hypothetical protein ABTA85_19455, partial [Acinetobacter baumannii]
ESADGDPDQLLLRIDGHLSTRESQAKQMCFPSGGRHQNRSLLGDPGWELQKALDKDLNEPIHRNQDPVYSEGTYCRV